MDKNMIISIVYMVALFAIFYFLFIRPQRKKEKQLDQLRSSLEVGPNRTKMPFKKWAIASVEKKED